MRKTIQFPFPIFITREGSWFVAECPLLTIASQGKTEREVKENMADLIREYLNDPDTPKGQLKKVSDSSLVYIPVRVSENLFS